MRVDRDTAAIVADSDRIIIVKFNFNPVGMACDSLIHRVVQNFGNQMKYADRRGSPVAVIAGSDEFDAGKVQIKDLVLGAKIAENATLEEWKERPSQFEVPRGDMVAKVREILDGQGG